MTNIANFDRNRDLTSAIEHHIAGRYDQAEQIYLQLHQHHPRDEEVLYLLGVLCCDLGMFTEACRFLEHALTIQARFPEASRQLAIALRGNAAKDIESKKFDEAEIALKRALQLTPGDGESLLRLGQITVQRGDIGTAERLFKQALQKLGNHVDALNWHGLASLQLQQYADAEQSLRLALAINPALSQARNNLGLSLHHQGRLQEACECFMTAMAHDPAYTNARINLANTLRILGRLEEALVQLEGLRAEYPDSVELLNNLGTVLQDIGQAEQACHHLKHATALNPAWPEVRWNLALSQLLLGEYARGWANFEARWEGCPTLRGAYDKPPERAWRGEPLQGKRLLLWAEQGFGDTVQFIRFAEDLAQQGATVIVEAPEELSRLIATAAGVNEVIRRGQTLPSYDLHCPLMSLPHRLEVTLASPLGKTAYLKAGADQASAWKMRLASYIGVKIGLVWAGKSRLQQVELAAIDKRRSIQLQQLARLLEVPGCQFFSLQKDMPEDISQSGLPIHDFSMQWHDFADTAAFIDNLDLVISVDTAVAHLAGALGKPVWLLNRYDSCWRWLLERNDSPWYPTLCQFRQPRSGDWQTVIHNVHDALMQLRQ